MHPPRLRYVHPESLPSALLASLRAEAAGPVLEWLAEAHGLPFSVVENFTYPGHSARRMHGLPTRSGTDAPIAQGGSARDC